MTDKPNPQLYEDRQRQRALERNVRRWKRRETVAMDDGERDKAKAKVRQWQSEMRKFVDENDRKRLYAREQVTT